MDADIPGPERQHLRAWALATLGPDTTHQSPAESLGRLCRAVVTVVAASGAAVVLRTPAGDEAVAAATDAVAQRHAELEFDTGEGPASEAIATGRPVLVPDLHADIGCRWPGYSDAARRTSLAAKFSFPLSLGAARFGVLCIFDERPRPLDPQQTARALTVAEVATDVLLRSTSSNPMGDLDASLQTTLRFRSEIYQAQGALTVALGVSLSEALARMRAHAFATGQDLTAVAIDIVEGRLHLPRDTDDPDEGRP